MIGFSTKFIQIANLYISDKRQIQNMLCDSYKGVSYLIRIKFCWCGKILTNDKVATFVVIKTLFTFLNVMDY